MVESDSLSGPLNPREEDKQKALFAINGKVLFSFLSEKRKIGKEAKTETILEKKCLFCLSLPLYSIGTHSTFKGY